MPQPEKLDPRIVGRRIAESRKARGKTQEEMAEFLNCSRPTYIAIEKGERLAKSDEIVKLAAFLGRTPPMTRRRSASESRPG
jgi:transcriptional regulator with XRE-family HTH domain